MRSKWDMKGREALEKKWKAAARAFKTGRFQRAKELLEYLAKADKKYGKAAGSYEKYIREVERGRQVDPDLVAQMSSAKLDGLAPDPWSGHGGPDDLLAAMIENG